MGEVSCCCRRRISNCLLVSSFEAIQRVIHTRHAEEVKHHLDSLFSTLGSSNPIQVMTTIGVEFFLSELRPISKLPCRKQQW